MSNVVATSLLAIFEAKFIKEHRICYNQAYIKERML